MTVAPTEIPLPPNRLVLIIDGEVVDVMRTPDRLAAVLLSQPLVLNMTADPRDVQVGMRYDHATDTFSVPTAVTP